MKIDKKSIKIRLITIFIITSVIPILVINILSYYNTSRLASENIESMTKSNLQQTKVSLDVWLDSYEDILFQVYTDDYIVDLVDKLNAGEDTANNRKLLRKTLRGLFYTKDYVKAITVITESGELVFYDQLTASSTYTSWMDSMSMSQEELYRKISRDNKTHLLPTGEKIKFGSDSYSLFHIGHRIIDYRDVEKQCGIVMVSIDESLLQEVCSSTAKQLQNENKNGLNFIVDSQGYLISCAGSEETGKPVFSPYANQEEKMAAYKNLAKRTGLLETGEISVYTVYDEKTGWSVIRATNQEELLLSLDKQQKLVLSITLLSLLAVLLVMTLQVNRMTGSIKRVVEAMRKAGKGNLTVHVPQDHTRPTEIEIIAEEFNSTMDKLKMSTEKQKNAEIMALEAQINPHFLYNTLDTINWMAIDKDEYEISNAISALAHILRYGIVNSNGMVSLKEEAEWLRQYLFLQQTRLKNTFECQIHIEPELMELSIHKLLLQPFLENAILHGFEGTDRKHCLEVRMRREESYVVIEIEDNGQGMPEKKVREINEGIFRQTDDRKHIGMENAITRMKMYYGENAQVTVKSTLGAGTEVCIRIPAEKGEQES